MFVWLCASSGILGALRPCKYVSHGTLLLLPLAPLANYKTLTCASSR